MAASVPPSRVIRFATYEARLGSGELYKDGHRIKLQEQPFQVLATLLERPGELVTREELREKLWPTDTFVDFDTGLNSAIKRLRDALNDSADEPRYIETLPRRGYRFICAVNGARADVRATPAPHPRRWVAALLLAVVSAVLAVLWTLNIGGLQDRILGRPSAGEIRSIAVLPLKNVSGDPEQEYLAVGTTEMLITELGKISALRVISHQSMMRYRNAAKTLPEIAQELKVDAVLEGTVAHSDGRIRITTNLVQAAPERHLFSQSYERNLQDVFRVQGEVARDVASQTHVRLTPQEQARLSSSRPVNPEAHEAYLKGRYFFNRPETGHKAAQYFQEAIRKDPEYAPAYAGLADAYLWTSFGEILLPPREWFAQARAAAEKALELDPTLAEAHASLASINDWGDWSDWDGARQGYERAIALNPNYANAHAWYAQHLAFRGQFREAEAEIKRAEELDPLSLFIKVQVGWIYLWAGQLDRAMEQWQKVVELDPNFPMAHYNLGMGYALKAKYPESIASYRKALTLQDFSYNWLMLAHAHAMAGEKAEARKILTKMKERSKREYIPPFLWANVYLALGEKEQALDWLEKGYRDRDPVMPNIKLEPFWWQSLRDEPRFQALLRRLNFPGPWPENYSLMK